MRPILILISVISACAEDPILKAAREGSAAEAATASPGGQPGTASKPPPGGNREHKPGIPEEPEPGGAGKPPPGAPGEPGPGVPDEPSPGVPDEPPPEGGYRKPPPTEGSTVEVRGRVDLLDWYQGPIRIDVFDGDQLQFGGPRPGVVTMLTLEEPGEFVLQIPESVGQIWISAFNDEDRDGRPGPLDPTGYYNKNPLSISDDELAGVGILLERRDPPGGKVDDGL